MRSRTFSLKSSNSNEKPMKTFSPRLRQVFLAIGPIILTISFGIAEGFSAILLPQLENGDDIPIDADMGSWIASITALPMSLGCILGGWLMEVVGRKGTSLLTCVPSLISWLMIVFSYDITLLLVARFISGLCIGLMGPASSVYFAEATDPHFRGFLMGTLSAAITSGVLLAHIMGTFLTWRTVALISSSTPILCFISMIFVPESPSYLIKKNKVEEGKKAFHWLRGYGPEAESELEEIVKRNELHLESSKSFRQYINDLKKPEFYKPLSILLLFFTIMQWSGHNSITFYSVTIAKQTMGGTVDEYLATIAIDTVRILASIACCFILKIMKRRANLLFGGIAAGMFLMTLGLFVHFSNTYPNLFEDYPAVPLIAFIGSMGSLSMAIIPLPWAMSGELFPLSTRGLGSGITTTYNYLLIFMVVKATPFIFSSMGTDGAFLLFGSVVLAGTATLMFVLPETNGVPLHEIEDSFKKEKPGEQQ